METISEAFFLEHAGEALGQLNNGILLLCDSETRYHCKYFNDYVADILGYTREEMEAVIYDDPLAMIYPLDREKVSISVRKAATDGFSKLMGRMVAKDGHGIWIIGHYCSVTLGSEKAVVVTFTNVDEIVGASIANKTMSDKLAAIVNSIPVGIAIFNIKDGKNNTLAINDNMVTFCESMGKKLDGNDRRWTKEGLILLLNQNIYVFSKDEDIKYIDKMLTESEHEFFTNCYFRLRGSTEGNEVFIYSTCHRKENEDGSANYYVTFQDFTDMFLQERKIRKQQNELMLLSYYDPLTKAKNRNAYNAFIEKCKTERLYNVGVAFADLNGLKKVNDTLGHNFGDKMFIRFINIIKKFFDLENVFRISGDEFVIINANISKSEFQERMRHVIDGLAADENVASIGYIWKENVSDIKRRASQAEAIMYVEKQKYYETERCIVSKHRPILLNTLLRDLENNRYVMYLQPKCGINGGKALGAEALVRKIDENGNIIPPYEFIPVLEHEKLIPKIDMFMLEEVCKLLQELKQNGNEEFKISVNMSRVTLVENDYIKNISDICSRYNFNRSQLEFEMTESNATMDSIRLEDYLKQIKELGIGVSLDDVGTDYSSLPLLILDGVDTVKLDRSLVIQLSNEKAKKLLMHVIDMCHDLGLSIIAEGVETDEVRQALAEMNCDMYQGYLMSKPVPALEFKERFL